MADPKTGWTPVDESAWTDVAPPPDPKLSLAYQRQHGADVLTEGPDAPPPSGPLADLNRSLMGAAYPQSAGDFAQLLIPAGVSTAYSAAKAYGAAAKDAWAANPSLKQLPFGMVRALAKKASAPPPTVAGLERYGGNRSGYVAGEAPSTVSEALPGLTAPKPIVDEAGASLGGYAGPERRVSDLGRASRRDPHDQLLERLGGRSASPPAAAQELAQRLGQPGDAEMAMAVSHRNATGGWAPSPASATGPQTLNQAMDAAVKAQRVREALLAQLANQ